MTIPAGVCRFCGCSEYDACRVDVPFEPATEPCSWTDRTRSVCSACAPAAKAEAIALRTLAKAGYRSEEPRLSAPLDFVAAFHQGFRVGWFGISPRSPASRNPWPPMRKWALKREAWTLGQPCRRRGLARLSADLWPADQCAATRSTSDRTTTIRGRAIEENDDAGTATGERLPLGDAERTGTMNTTIEIGTILSHRTKEGMVELMINGEKTPDGSREGTRGARDARRRD